MGKHKFTDEIAQRKRQKAKHKLKIIACIERATVLRANCRAQRSGARLGNRDVAPVARCSLGPENVKCMSRFWPPGAPCIFGTRDLHLLLGVSKYVSDRARYF